MSEAVHVNSAFYRNEIVKSVALNGPLLARGPTTSSRHVLGHIKTKTCRRLHYPDSLVSEMCSRELAQENLLKTCSVFCVGSILHVILA